MASLFRLPDETILLPLLQRFPGRDHQIRSLASLLYANAVPCRNLVIHGTEATGKTVVTEQLLLRLSQHEGLLYTTVNAAQCITGRHLFECILGSVADALRRRDGEEQHRPSARRCETLAQLAVALSGLLEPQAARDPRWRFVLVLDAVDKQREGPPTLLPALARFSEIIPCLTCVFIVTAPPAGFLRTPLSPHLHFPPYTKSEFVRILSLDPPPPLWSRPSSLDDEDDKDDVDCDRIGDDGSVRVATQQETSELWIRFCAAVYDALVKSASGTLPSFRHSCQALWPRFTAPIVARTHSPKEFSKLLIAARVHFQDESLLNPSIISIRGGPKIPTTTTDSTVSATTSSAPAPNAGSACDAKSSSAAQVNPHASSAAGLTTLLPIAARLLLLSAYLASHNATRHDLALFSTYFHGRKRKRGGGFAARGAAAGRSKHRKIARKLLGAHAFVLERMMAIFEAVRGEWLDANSAVGAAGLDGDVGMAMATLSSLRLLIRVGTGDVIDRGGKWRINVGWEAIRGVGRSIGVDIEEWLIE